MKTSSTVSDLKAETTARRSGKQNPARTPENPLLLDYCVKQNDYTLLYVEDMADLQKKVAEAVRKSGMEDDRLSNEVELIGEVYRSARYRTDESKGICDDLDKNSVRYVNVERNRVFKMKSGKFMRELILETRIGKSCHQAY